MLKVIIAGSRDFDDYDFLEEKCLEIFASYVEDGYLTGHLCQDRDNLEIISGTACGADILGEKFARKRGLKIRRFPAQWDKYGKSAGYIRNKDMTRYAISNDDHGVLIAFWDGKSRGTKHMIDIAKRYGLEVFVIDVAKQ